GPPMADELVATARLALEAARTIGELDLGQAVVAVGQRIVAAEDIAGTDALLHRTTQLRAAGLTGDGGETMVLAKASKPQQPLAVDMPAIGPDTVTGCAKAGIGLIVLEAGRCLVLGADELKRRARATGISVVGLASDG
uniref:LpxI family protein n=1 Tax=Devosia sp. TaxID=1871048 RepID=UPI003A8F9FAB